MKITNIEALGNSCNFCVGRTQSHAITEIQGCGHKVRMCSACVDLIKELEVTQITRRGNILQGESPFIEVTMKKLSPLGVSINKFMQDEGVSWYRLSMLSGVNEGTLSKLKYGKVSPTEYTMERIAKALNVNHSDIINKKEKIVAGYRIKSAGKAFIEHVGYIINV